MKKTYIIVILAIIAILGGIIIGTWISQKDKTYNFKQEPEKTLAKENQNTLNEIYAITTSFHMDVETTPNTLFIFKTYYKECKHTKIQKIEIPKEDVNKTEEDLQEKYRDWGIKEFTSAQVVFCQEKEGICNEHYVLRELNGYVAIYTVDELGKEILKQTTEIVIQYLPEADKESLKNGIKVNGEENLNATLEDYE